MLTRLFNKIFGTKLLKQYKVGETYFFNDTVPKGHIENEFIPDVIFDRNVSLYNCGYDSKRKLFKVIASGGFKEVGDKLKN